MATNMGLLAELDKIVHSHTNAKKYLINLIRSIQSRYLAFKYYPDKFQNLKPRSCLLVGESGSGKTYMVETLAKICKIPFINLDATELTHTSARGGMDKEKLIRTVEDKLYDERRDPESRWYNMDVDEIAMNSIVFVDEIDKLGNKSGDGWNQGTQANFLTTFGRTNTPLANMTFIFAGAFSGVEYRETTGKKGLGFVKEDIKSSTVVDDLEARIISAGITPELLGRMGTILVLDKLTTDDFVHIITEQIIPRKQFELQFIGVTDWSLTGSEIASLADKAVKSGLGVRYLHKEMDKLCQDVEFEAPYERILDEQYQLPYRGDDEEEGTEFEYDIRVELE